IALNPANEYAHFEIANVFSKVKDDVHAEEEYGKALSLNPCFAGAALELGKFYFYRQRRLDKAIESFSLVTREDPQCWEAHFELGKIYKLREQYLPALEAMKDAARITETIAVCFELGKLSRDLGMPQDAIAQFRKAFSQGQSQGDIFLKNKALNEIEITERKIVLESKVRAMVGMICNICNVQCIMCTIWKTPWEASRQTMDEIVSLFPYMEDMVWEGGEVFMMKGFEEVLEEASCHRHLKQVIFTNGLVINERIIQKLIRGRVDIVFSIDAGTKETYEYIRKGGKFERLRNNLALVKEAKEKSGGRIETHFNAVIMRANYREIPQLIDFAKEFNFNAVTITPIRGFKDQNIFENNDQEALAYLEGVIPSVTQKAYEYGLIFNNWLPGMQVSCENTPQDDSCGCVSVSPERKNQEELIGLHNDRLICHAPWQRLVIDNEGQVRPFVFCLDKWIGNVNHNSLHQIWNSENMQEYRRRLISRDFERLCQPECINGQVSDKIRDII
ncbi:MAG: radical SAM protein, partial [Candidatus Omnitrophica bacterium]|nr:radical SAM protein [Candidatus Omnitrophota bacterium]